MFNSPLNAVNGSGDVVFFFPAVYPRSVELDTAASDTSTPQPQPRSYISVYHRPGGAWRTPIRFTEENCQCKSVGSPRSIRGQVVRVWRWLLTAQIILFWNSGFLAVVLFQRRGRASAHAPTEGEIVNYFLQLSTEAHRVHVSIYPKSYSTNHGCSLSETLARSLLSITPTWQCVVYTYYICPASKPISGNPRSIRGQVIGPVLLIFLFWAGVFLLTIHNVCTAGMSLVCTKD
jgi:hypothetical protein